ncbi:AraC family transcriptional regulator [Gaopeijia maritima]|uniref:Helix-turn-helix domain-containing protein n=1 Tax=Gaopeijia maritima TaxID=3119007 RepID=A0ABU9E9J3_9BACT
MLIDLDEAGRGRASQRRIRPPADARSWLEYGWIQRHEPPPDAAPHPWRVVPDTAAHVLVHGYPDRRTRALVVGPRSEGIDLDLSRRRWTVGLRLRPGMVPALLGDRADDWVDGGVPLEAVVPPPLRGSTRDLDGCPPPTLALALASVVGAALRRVEPHWSVSAFLRTARSAPTAAPVEWIAARMGLSPRTLRALLRRELGLGPRTVLRIGRVQAAARRIVDAPDAALSRIAHASGFSDHSHLCREFARLMGEPPSGYQGRARRGDRPAETFKVPGPGACDRERRFRSPQEPR